MKKLIAFVLAFTMVAAMAVPALAEEGTTTDTTNNTNVTEAGKEASIPVHGTYQGPQDVISVDVVWDAMDFIYTDASEGTWNPTTHKYENSIKQGWSWKKPEGETKTAPEIKLSNHSNVGVKAAFGFAASEGLDGLEGNFTNLTDENAFTLTRALENTDPSTAPSKATAFSLSGDGITGDNVELGKITVTISKDDTTTPDTPEETVEDVGNQEALLLAINKGNSVSLLNDINVQWDTPAMGVEGYTGTIDLNNRTLSISDNTQMHIAAGSTATIKNGTVKGSSSSFFVVIKDENTNVTMNSCTIENSGTASAVYVENGTALLNDCTLTCTNGSYALVVENGNVTLSGNTKLAANTTTSPVNVKSGNLICLAGTYNFDPKAYVDDTKFDVNENAEEASWTVTAKTPSEG